MKQYHELLKTILEKGTKKPAARENMPGTTSLFGYQFRHNLADGFPLLTTKKMNFKNIVVELLWFLKGDTNIKYLNDHDVKIWNEDSYNYYCKIAKINADQNRIMNSNGDGTYKMFLFDEFITIIKNNSLEQLKNNLSWNNYTLGDCGFQYGKVWRDLYSIEKNKKIDQIKNIINSLQKSPESRRHVISAWDMYHDNELALTWCHAMFQFNCRQLTNEQRMKYILEEVCFNNNYEDIFKTYNPPKYYLDCHMFQRSGDVFLGVPYDNASFALLTHIIAKICNMIPGDLIVSYGDVHIYDNHQDQVQEILKRKPTTLPTLKIAQNILNERSRNYDFLTEELPLIHPNDFTLDNYNPQSYIKAELSTGLIK